MMVELCVNQVGHRPQVTGTAPDDPSYSGHIKAGRPRAPDREMQDSIYSASLPIMTIRTVAIRAARREPEIFAAVAHRNRTCVRMDRARRGSVGSCLEQTICRPIFYDGFIGCFVDGVTGATRRSKQGVADNQ